jgi:outer membrane protein OmpA-like peptidoglycan-associated protein
MKNVVFNRGVILVLLVFVGTKGFSQRRLLDIANEQYEMFEYMNAQRTYLKVVENGHSSMEVLKNLGNTYYFNSQFEQALVWYRKLIISYGGEVESEYYYRYAQTLKSIGNYKEADLYMQAFSKLNPDDRRGRIFLQQKAELEKLLEGERHYSVQNLSMNSNFRDFGTTYFKDSIIFSSSRMEVDEDQKIVVHKWNNEPYLDMFIATRDTLSGQLYEITKWSSVLNSRLHESTPVFTKDYKTVYFTGNTFEKRKVKKIEKGKIKTNNLKIYKSTYIEKKGWAKPEALPFCSDAYSSAHPALSNDGKTMYFSSDMEGSIGGSDIFAVAINADGSFGEPKSLGTAINTEGKETFPFISYNNDLYFSSDGHLGYGGLDIFKISIADLEKNLDHVVNLGPPINSKDDDFAMVLEDGSKKGYFTSNRVKGKGKDDIFSFEEIEFKKGDDLAKVLELNTIYFDLDKSFIRPDAAVILDKIVAVMKAHPSMKVYIRSHTDSRATHLYNEGLSDRRANSTKAYLIFNGIDRNRLASKGFGETELVNHCSDGVKCSEEEHQLNRRSEFIITEL